MTAHSPPCAVGDRVQLIAMGIDPDPLPSGAIGTVRALHSFGLGSYQVSVLWDEPNRQRGLALVYPEDSFTVLPSKLNSTAENSPAT